MIKRKTVIINKFYRCDMSDLPGTTVRMQFILANDNSCNTNFYSKVTDFDAKSKNINSKSNFYFPTILDKFIEKNGSLPNPQQASTIGTLIAKRVRASDGQLYPKLTKSERININIAKDKRKKYHRRTENIMKLKLALECLSSDADPAELAVHMKNASDVGERLDSALDWLGRFAKELGKRDKACCQ